MLKGNPVWVEGRWQGWGREGGERERGKADSTVVQRAEDEDNDAADEWFRQALASPVSQGCTERMGNMVVKIESGK
jgi:hypothetical protein